MAIQCQNCGANNEVQAKLCRECGKELSVINSALEPEILTPDYPPPLLGEKPYAGFWRRFLAFLIDGILMQIIMIPLAILSLGLTAFMSGDLGTASSLPAVLLSLIQLLITLISTLITWLYYALMESSKFQGTVGKLALGIKVTDLNGHKVSFIKASGRYFGKVLSSLIFGIGFLMAAFTEKKQALHDILAGCLVVKKQ